MKKQNRWPIVFLMLLIAGFIFLLIRMERINRELQEKADQMSLMISRYEAKAQFIEKYEILVVAKTDSKIVAKRILAAVYENSLWCRLDPELILSVIDVESDFHWQARSDAGAVGLMQIMPVTGIYVGRSLGLRIENDDDLEEIETNIQIGCVFLKECIERLGEKRGLGFYYAGRHSNYYKEYTDKIAKVMTTWNDRGGENGTP